MFNQLPPGVKCELVSDQIFPFHIVDVLHQAPPFRSYLVGFVSLTESTNRGWLWCTLVKGGSVCLWHAAKGSSCNWSEHLQACWEPDESKALAECRGAVGCIGAVWWHVLGGGKGATQWMVLLFPCYVHLWEVSFAWLKTIYSILPSYVLKN